MTYVEAILKVLAVGLVLGAGLPAVFAVGLVEALLWYRVEQRLIFVGDGLRPGEGATTNLVGFAWGLGVLALLWLPCGVLGAAFGSRLAGRAPRLSPA